MEFTFLFYYFITGLHNDQTKEQKKNECSACVACCGTRWCCLPRITHNSLNWIWFPCPIYSVRQPEHSFVSIAWQMSHNCIDRWICCDRHLSLPIYYAHEKMCAKFFGRRILPSSKLCVNIVNSPPRTARQFVSRAHTFEYKVHAALFVFSFFCCSIKKSNTQFFKQYRIDYIRT